MGKLRGLHPAECDVLVRVRGGTRRGEAADKRKHCNDDVAVVVREAREGAKNGDFATEFFAELAGESGFGGLAGLDLAAGKFPFEREVFVRRALRDEHAAGGVLDDGADDGNGRF